MRASDLIRELQAEIGVHGDHDVLLQWNEDGFPAEAGVARIEFDNLQGEFPIRGPQFILVAADD